jgi:hypothetical protein
MHINRPSVIIEEIPVTKNPFTSNNSKNNNSFNIKYEEKEVCMKVHHNYLKKKNSEAERSD